MLEILKKNVILLLVFTCSTNLFCQISMTNATNTLLNENHMRSRNPGAIIDINGDLIDDIIVLDKGFLLKPMISDGKHLNLTIADTLELPKYAWTLAAGDINNDGNIEIITSGQYNNIQLSSLKNGKWIYNLINSNAYAQASNTVDFNNDGWLDYFLCDDDGAPKTYINDKNGKLIPSSVIDFSINDTTDGSGNYGSEWADVNGDFLPDLYLAKCRSGVSSPLDKRRINRLYINQGNGSFIDEAKKYGVDNGAQSWVGAIGDLDNDGFNDIFLANHYESHVLYKNVNGQKFDVVGGTNFVNNFALQAVIRDMDNDGFQDILMAGVDGPFCLHNKGNMKFEYVEDVFLGSYSRSFAIGDVNDDGFTDIYSMKSEPVNRQSLSDDELLINNGNDNHFIKVSLIGTQSNKSAIGAHLSIYGPWGVQVRTVKGGESYGITNSLQAHFGLGKSTQIDSLIVRWPSGNIDKFTQLPVDETLVVEEGKCATAQEYIAQNIIYIIDTIILPTMDDRNSYLWSNGSTSKQITINTEGSYTLTSRDVDGCLHISKPIIVRSACLKSDASKVFENELDTIFCEGAGFVLSAVEAPLYKWSTGDTVKTIMPSSPGIYGCTISDFCGNSYSATVTVKSVNPIFTVEGDSIAKGNVATLTSSSSSTVWFDGKSLLQIGKGETFITEPLDSSNVFYAQNVLTISEKSGNVGAKNFPPKSDEYGSNNTDGNLIFDVIQPIKINSVVVKTDLAGNRKLLIRQGNDIIWEKLYQIDTGLTKINVDVDLLPGDNYSFETDATTNIQNFNHKGPRLARNLGDTNFPYEILDAISIRSTKFGEQYYYYFYDWDISYDIEYCASDLLPVIAVVEGPIATKDELLLWKIYPNPSSQYINIVGGEDIKVSKITDQIGHLHPISLESNTLNVSDLPNGMYFLHLSQNNYKFVIKFIKM